MTDKELLDLTRGVAATAAQYDAIPQWPQWALDALTIADAWRWAIPARWGGAALDAVELLTRYEAVARGSVSVALILTQRDGACDLLASCENAALQDRLLPAYARGERFTSVGIAQLTTSQGAGGRPHLTAVADGDGFVLDGAMPWVTGAKRCHEIIAGAVLPDGAQLLVATPCDADGVVVRPPMKLLALESSCTARVECRAVHVSHDQVLRGPAENVLKRNSPAKPFVVLAVGLGLAASIDDYLALCLESAAAEIRAPLDDLRGQRHQLRERVWAVVRSDAGGAPPERAELRAELNVLLTRMAAALMTASKGAGFARPHPAERMIREATFFHVWSAPAEIRAATLNALLG